MDKEEKKRLKQNYKNSEKQIFESNLPFSVETFQALFDYIDKKLDDNDCDDTLRFTNEFLTNNNLDIEVFKKWAGEYGGYCDCEVLANLEEKIEEL